MVVATIEVKAMVAGYGGNREQPHFCRVERFVVGANRAWIDGGISLRLSFIHERCSSSLGSPHRERFYARNHGKGKHAEVTE